MNRIFIIILMACALISCQTERIGISKVAVLDSNFQKNKEAANVALKEALDVGYPDISLILSMLAKKKYLDLELYFSNLEEKYKNNTSYESLLLKSYQIFDSQFDSLLPQLNEWVEKRGTHIAFCARGFYYSNKGFKARGKKYIQDTPRSNILKMEEFHKKAKFDLEKSIEINPNLMPAYYELIGISMAAGDDVYKKTVYQEAIKHDRRTYYVRYSYLRSLTPRWGGSYDQMQSVINESIRFAHLNPRIWVLRGTVDFEKAYVFLLEKKYYSAIDFLSKALSYGDRTEWLAERAYCYSKTKQYKFELKDLERYLFYKPNNTNMINYVQRLRRFLANSN